MSHGVTLAPLCMLGPKNKRARASFLVHHFPTTFSITWPRNPTFKQWRSWSRRLTKLWLYYTAVPSYSRESTDDECDGVGSDMSMKGEALEADPFALCLQMRKRTGWTDWSNKARLEWRQLKKHKQQSRHFSKIKSRTPFELIIKINTQIIGGEIFL